MGRHKLTERDKLNRKLARLQKEIEEIKIKLSGNLIGDIEKQKLEV